MKVAEGIFNVGLNDREIDLFEGLYVVPNGIAYNSYVVLDDKITVFDTIDSRFSDEWLANLGDVLGDKTPDYLVVEHMEPDHSASIAKFVEKYPEAKVVANAKIFTMIAQFFGNELGFEKVEVKDGDELCTGKHNFKFVFAPMVHWPEVMVAYDTADKILFSADAFGKFGALDCDEPWDDEARRSYIGIVGIYGNTKKAAELLYDKLIEKGCSDVRIFDLARSDKYTVLAEAFRCSKLVLASPTYNSELFPHTRAFVDMLCERGYKNRTVGIIENGSWAPVAANLTRKRMADLKNITFAENTVTVKSALNAESVAAVEALADELMK